MNDKISGDAAVRITELVARIKAAKTADEIRTLRGALRRLVRARDVADMTGPPDRTIVPGEDRDSEATGSNEPVDQDPQVSAPEPTPPGRSHPARRNLGAVPDPGGYGHLNDLKAKGVWGLINEASRRMDGQP